MSKADTKEKILETASELFATSGYHGASIRDIAKKAEVNLAAVNYHFKNKDGLFAAVILRSKALFIEEVTALDDGKISAFDMAMSIQQVYKNHVNEFRNGFALFLSGEGENVMKEIFANSQDFGPPGINVFRKVLKRNYPDKSMVAIEWASRAILSQMSHKTLLTQTPMFQVICDKSPKDYSFEIFEVFLAETVQAILDRLENSGQELEAKITNLNS